MIILFVQFPKIQMGSLINIEKILDWSISKFYTVSGINAIATELSLTKPWPTSFYKKQDLVLKTMPTDVNKVLKTKC